MSNFWGGYIIFIVVLVVVACLWLLLWTRKFTIKDVAVGQTLDHSFDGIQEYNNPLPRWWLIVFLLSFVFLVGYLVAYPGLGFYKGLLGWSSQGELAQDQQRAKKTYGALYAELAAQPVETLVHNPQALKIGQNLFSRNCSACHGADGRGSIGFPNLTDTHWIYGGTPEEIKTTITYGRQGMMPPQEPVLRSDQTIQEVVQYILKINRKSHDENQALKGETTFKQVCSVCHGQNAEGNKQLSAPNLTHNAWTFGGTPLRIEMTIRYGRQAVMPAHKDILSPEQIHLLTTYVYSLSKTAQQDE